MSYCSVTDCWDVCMYVAVLLCRVVYMNIWRAIVSVPRAAAVMVATKLNRLERVWYDGRMFKTLRATARSW